MDNKNGASFNNLNKIAYREYFKKKQIAHILEETNNNSIIAFPSVETKGERNEWLKIGGNSALFYKYIIAPRLHKKPPTIRQDTDLNYRFESGIISIHWRDIFIKNMASLNLVPRTNNGILIFNLKHTFIPSEIKKLKLREREDRNRINKLLRPANTNPELYHLLINLAKTLTPKIEKLREPYRRDFGSGINHSIAELFKTYISTVNGNLDKTVAKSLFLNSLDDINAILIILNENKLLDYSIAYRSGVLLNGIKNSINKDLK